MTWIFLAGSDEASAAGAPGWAHLLRLTGLKDKKANTLTFPCTCRYCNLAIPGDNKMSCLRRGRRGEERGEVEEAGGGSDIPHSSVVVYFSEMRIGLDNK